VLSSLHTTDAVSTIDRLTRMGFETLLVATAVNVIQAQRLVRRICDQCKVESKVPISTLVKAGVSKEEAEHIRVFKGEGCEACNSSGYKGRTGLFETLEISESIRDSILAGISGSELRRRAIAEGMMTLRESGLERIRQGLTTVEEVLRET